MNYEQKVTLLKVTAFEYDFAGRKGVSYKALVLSDGAVYNCKTDAGFFAKHEKDIEKKGTGSFKVSPLKVTTQKGAQKECAQLELVAFA